MARRSRPWQWCALEMHYLLSGRSLEELQAKALTQYGPDARLVSAEKVTTPRVGGLLRGFHYEAVVRVGDGTDRPGNSEEPAQAPQRPTPGLDRLLARAEARERGAAQAGGDEIGSGSASSPGRFAQLLDAQSFELEPATGRRAAREGRAPGSLQEFEFSNHPGQLLLVLGLGTDARVAAGMLDPGTCLLRHTGQAPEPQALFRPINTRRAAQRVRAAAVEQGGSVLVSKSLAPLQAVPEQLRELEPLEADQWVVAVDARIKSEDTAGWVSQVAQVRQISGVLLLHARQTLTPGSAGELGYRLLSLPRE